ncbi:DUF397 domain-containing protein [Amycolatopsis antarctica]|uniref:DUF397 domain-containing protein n=1 Tax=Amycolatopsis antarctica TaxID=1854586 RepID=A0A263D1H4_9PSEU|nr:DUF397 domain-containing protein [Amycolatopsis antarctica]OZM71366.1 DUF397 domain-containing protein [Amycolatopsis antarctica]
MTTADPLPFAWRKSSYSGNQSQCVEIGFAWRKSSHSGNETNCVEVGFAAEPVVGIRDTKDRDGGALVFSRKAFTALLHTAR